MKLLVTLESQRHVLLTAPTATAQELRDKACAEAGVDPMQYELIFSRMAVPLERSLAELGIQDRERLELRARTSRAQSGSAEVERVVLSLSASSAQLDAYESTLGVGEPPHQELFTRVLEALDGIKLDGLSDVEVQNARGQRKALVRRCEALATAAAELEQQAKAAESQQPNA